MSQPTADALWLTPAEQRAWRSFIYGTTSLLERLSQVLEQDPRIDLTLHEYEILVRLSETADGRVRMSDLADSVVHSRSRLTHTVARLEKRGLVERVRCVADGRGREAALTAAGRALLELAAPAHVASVRALLLDVVGTEDFETLGRIIARTIPAQASPGGPSIPAGAGAADTAAADA